MCVCEFLCNCLRKSFINFCSVRLKLKVNFFFFVLFLSFTGPLLSEDQLKKATGSCKATCTPTSTNDATVVTCCFAQNNCNNLFGMGPHHYGGHSGERGINSTMRSKNGGKAEIQGKKSNKGK